MLSLFTKQFLHKYFFIFYERTINDTEICVEKQHEDYHSLESIDIVPTTNTLLTKIFIFNEFDKLIFARLNSYIMLPWFTIANILRQINEDKIKEMVS